ncbi:hypothetical protein [Arthrobacter sp. CP30]
MTLTNESAALFAQVFPVLLVILAIEGRVIDYGKLGKDARNTFITGRWFVVGLSLTGTLVSLAHVADPGGLYGVMSERFAGLFIRIAFGVTVLGLIVLFGVLQYQETKEKTQGR